MDTKLDKILKKLVGEIVVCDGFADYLFKSSIDKRYSVYNTYFNAEDVCSIVIQSNEIVIYLNDK